MWPCNCQLYLSGASRFWIECGDTKQLVLSWCRTVALLDHIMSFTRHWGSVACWMGEDGKPLFDSRSDTGIHAGCLLGVQWHEFWTSWSDFLNFTLDKSWSLTALLVQVNRICMLMFTPEGSEIFCSGFVSSKQHLLDFYFLLRNGHFISSPFKSISVLWNAGYLYEKIVHCRDFVILIVAFKYDNLMLKEQQLELFVHCPLAIAIHRKRPLRKINN